MARDPGRNRRTRPGDRRGGGRGRRPHPRRGPGPPDARGAVPVARPGAPGMNPRHVLTIAGLTLREMARRRVLWVLAGLVVASVVLVGWGTDRLVSFARED